MSDNDDTYTFIEIPTININNLNNKTILKNDYINNINNKDTNCSNKYSSNNLSPINMNKPINNSNVNIPESYIIHMPNSNETTDSTSSSEETITYIDENDLEKGPDIIYVKNICTDEVDVQFNNCMDSLEIFINKCITFIENKYKYFFSKHSSV